MRIVKRVNPLSEEERAAERLRRFGNHHMWCNFFMECHADDCTMCNGLNADHPPRTGDTSDDLMRRYFPDNRRIQ